MPDINTFIQAVKLPVMPEVAHALIRTLNDEDADVVTVRDIIAKDPALTTTLLRMANSALFGLSRSVTTLDSAVSVVGMTQIRARALGICMSQVFKLPDTINRLEFWRYSMVCAGYAKFLAHKIRIDEQQAWLTATMLRLGELVVALQHPEVIQPIEAQPLVPGERWQRERQLIGYDEGQITAEVARRWDFPDEVVMALAHCADPLAAVGQSPLCAVVHLAAMWAEQSSDLTALKASVAASPPAVLAYLGLDLAALLEEVPDPEQFSDISALLH
jgi:HD-like signal output (HDOD) protein